MDGWMDRWMDKLSISLVWNLYYVEFSTIDV
jgi:hypothetical protein